MYFIISLFFFSIKMVFEAYWKGEKAQGVGAS